MKTWILAMVMMVSAFGADTFYLGSYKITTAVVGPWWTEKAPPDPAEIKTLVGKQVVFAARQITGPRQVACRGPKYEVKDYPLDMIYEGAFFEMREKDKKVDPVKVGAKLGFTAPTSKTVETGCATELNFHFIDKDTGTFALNNYIYYFKRE